MRGVMEEGGVGGDVKLVIICNRLWRRSVYFQTDRLLLCIFPRPHVWLLNLTPWNTRRCVLPEQLSCRCCGQRSLPQSPHPNSTPLRFGICHGSWVQQCNEKDLFIKTSRTGTRHAGFKCKSHRNRAAPCGCVHFPRMLSTVSPSWGANVLCYKVGTKFVWSRGCFYKDPPVEGVYSPLSFFNLYFEACIIPSSPVSGSYQAWAHFYEPVYFSCQSCEGQRASPAL